MGAILWLSLAVIDGTLRAALVTDSRAGGRGDSRRGSSRQRTETERKDVCVWGGGGGGGESVCVSGGGGCVFQCV